MTEIGSLSLAPLISLGVWLVTSAVGSPLLRRVVVEMATSIATQVSAVMMAISTITTDAMRAVSLSVVVMVALIMNSERAVTRAKSLAMRVTTDSRAVRSAPRRASSSSVKPHFVEMALFRSQRARSVTRVSTSSSRVLTVPQPANAVTRIVVGSPLKGQRAATV